MLQSTESPVEKRRIMAEIPEKDLQDMFGWLRQGMDEWAVRTYLLKNLGVLDEGLNMDNFIGFNIYFKNKEEVDMLFNKDGTYYLVETKQKGKYRRGWNQLKAAVGCFIAEMIEHGEEPKEIVAVLATSSIKTVEKLTVQKFDWFEPEEPE